MDQALFPAARRIAPILLFALAIIPNLIAQTTGEWTTSWMSPSNNVANFPRVVSSAGRGDYIMASELGVYRTSDGGVTWSSIKRSPAQFDYRFTGVAYPSRNHMVLVADVPLGGDVNFGRVLVSTDAGSTWLGEDRFWTGEITSISMFDDLNGLAGLGSSKLSSDSLLVTTDGGVTWRGLPMPAGAVYPYEVYAVGASTWFTRAYDTTAKGTRLFRTTDAGATWTGSKLPSGVSTLTMLDAENIWGGGAIRPQQGAADEYRDIIMRSTDGGGTWTVALDTSLDWTSGIYSIKFADSNNGIAGGGSGQVYRTTDGGITWERQWLPSDRITEYEGIRDLAYPVADEAVGVSGSFGVVAFHGRRTLVMPEITAPQSSSEPHPLTATIAWTPVVGATGYDVQVADTVYEFNTVNHRYFDEPYFERTGVTATSLEVTFEPHKLFVIRVRARNETMTGDWSLRRYVRTAGEGKTLSSPTITSPVHMSREQPLELDLVWTEVPGAIGYDYRVAFEPTFLFTHVDEENHQGTTAHLTGLRRNTEHWARVRARDADGVMSEYVSIVFYTGGVASAEEDETIEFSASLRPNITGDVARLEVSLARAGSVHIIVVDVAGETVGSALYDRIESGTHALPIDVSALASGQYFVRMKVGGRFVSMPLVVAR